MEKIRHSKQRLSLRRSLILYIVFFIILALVLYAITASLCTVACNNIQSSYPPSYEKYYLTNEQGEQLGDGVYIGTIPASMSKKDEIIISVLEKLPIFTSPFYSVLCIIAAALLFYKNRLKKPLRELRTASEKIANNDLDFSIEYNRIDELGQLCTSFEIMRATLENNLSEMWHQIESRKQLNAAFAHDLRTPLTVLKGYNEMLQISKENGTKEIALTMGKHITRMENYVNSMSHLQRLEDTQPEYHLVALPPFLSTLYEGAKIICDKNGKRLSLQNETSISNLSIDPEFVLQVTNNLITNAVRYAHTSLTLSFSSSNNDLLVSVSDDGKGFNADSLHKSTSPYFTEEINHSEHFGLGLYICKLLCEHHNGYLHIENTSSGAKVTAFFKSHDL